MFHGKIVSRDAMRVVLNYVLQAEGQRLDRNLLDELTVPSIVQFTLHKAKLNGPAAAGGVDVKDGW